MVMPYTPEAVATIRGALARGQSPGRVRAELGWSESMFYKICARHGIDVCGALLNGAATVHAAAPALSAFPVESGPAVSHTPRIGRRTAVTTSLPAGVNRKFERFVHQSGLKPSRAAGAIVDDYLAHYSTKDIEVNARRARGEGTDGFVYINVGLSEHAAFALNAESSARGKGNSVGRLVKSILIRHFSSARAGASSSP